MFLPETWFVGRLAALAVVGLLGLACQGPDPLYRNGAVQVSGSGGTTGVAGHGGTTGTGGATGSGGANGSGGTIGSGGATTGTGGTTTGAGGATTGAGGTVLMGAGGTAGTGGNIGAGGTAGSAGMTGTAGGGGTAPACTACKVQIQTYCQDGTSTQQIGLYADVVNNSSTALPLSQVTFRYWFMLGETTDPPHLDIDYSMIPTSAITSRFVAVTPAVTGANEYLEVGFSAAAPTLSLFSDSGQLQLRVHATGYSSMFDVSQTTDYSFQACAGTAKANTAPFAPAPTITAYIGGVLAYGTEPM